jgi:hypothetical protein
MQAFSAFQAAVFKALAGEPTLAALVGSRIFDDVPHEAETTSTAFPRVTIGEQSADFAGTCDSDLFEIEITIHAWSRAPGRTECLNVIGAIYRALHRQSLPASAGYIVSLDYAGHDTAKEADGETYHATIRFTGLMQTS